MAAETARRGQEEIDVANEERDVEEEEDRCQHTAVGEPATGETDSKYRKVDFSGKEIHLYSSVRLGSTAHSIVNLISV